MVVALPFITELVVFAWPMAITIESPVTTSLSSMAAPEGCLDIRLSGVCYLVAGTKLLYMLLMPDKLLVSDTWPFRSGLLVNGARPE